MHLLQRGESLSGGMVMAGSSSPCLDGRVIAAILPPKRAIVETLRQDGKKPGKHEVCRAF